MMGMFLSLRACSCLVAETPPIGGGKGVGSQERRCAICGAPGADETRVCMCVHIVCVSYV